jgi:RNase P/RNase MRP subunit POP5
MRGTKDTKKSVLHASKNVAFRNISMKKNSLSVKQKILLPTLKEQQRYLVYSVLFSDAISNSVSRNNSSNFELVHEDIILQCNSLLGIFDGGKAGLMSVKYNADTFKGVIRVNNKYVDKLKLCLGLIKTINGKKVIIDCISVSGMLNKSVDKMNVRGGKNE